MKNYLCLTVLLLLMSSSYAQARLVLDYDRAGNQVQRQLCIGTCELVRADEDSKAISEKLAEPLAEQFDDTVIMYPNPTTGTLRLHWDASLRGVVEQLLLIDYQGRLLQKMDVQALEETLLDLNPYPNGSYLVKFIFQDQSIHTKQIIKK